MANHKIRVAVSTIALVLWPPSVWAAYGLMRPEYVSPVVEFMALGVAMLPALTAIWWLLSPSKWWEKAAISVVYLFVMLAVLFGMSLKLVCARFGGCF